MKLQQATKHAATYTLSLEASAPELHDRFNTYWEENKDILPQALVDAALKGGYRTLNEDRVVAAAGGPARFYQPVLAQMVAEWGQSATMPILFIKSVDFTEGPAPDTYTLEGIVYLEPEVRWSAPDSIPGIGANPLIVSLPKVELDTINNIVNNEIDTRLNSLAEFHRINETNVRIGCWAKLDVSLFRKEGNNLVEWKDESKKGQVWHVVQEKLLAPIFDTLISMKVGDTKQTTFTLPEQFGQLAGKEVMAFLHVIEIQERIVPELTNDIAQKLGFDNTTILLQSLTTAAHKHLLDSRKANTISLAEQQILSSNVQLDPIPIEWIVARANATWADLRSKMKTEREVVMRSFANVRTNKGEPIKNKAMAMAVLSDRIANDLARALILRSWGQLAGVEGASGLDSLHTYIQAVESKIYEVTEVKEQ